MFIPDTTDYSVLESAVIVAATEIFELQNANHHPEGGTLGFTMGTAVALGNLAAAYVSDATPKQKRGFIKIVVRMVRDSFDEPMTRGELVGISGTGFH